ncbi:PhzF family phenazine biosynthesis protein [Candidatus Uabimicrobium amorphum]|uniref:Phenazine biosynthesis protein PhzF n=1 Tax=Uabimicrobium amorphum TaxID=2596890 RepID=A0A5S9F131_UABAM|nr:PhzF family phenazine biosynthesis protein [Candidatus Uabimicrobium amorphum]BBM82235.1 phenazine biosynthesis protein PhzF [Candidatus Uabimicrobium amorphum]
MTRVYKVNAFVQNNRGGNPAGVVTNSENLSEQRMQKMAHEMGFSETAFISSSQQADFTIRFFTPNKEVDLCGHATIASFHLLQEQQRIHTGRYTMETKAGILNIDCLEDGTIYMQQNVPQFCEVVPPSEIVPCLHLEKSKFSHDIQVVSTGLRKIFAPICDLATLESIAPNYDAIIEVSKKYSVTGIYCFTLEVESCTARCRNFAPLVGIYEDAATGTSAAALSCYLVQHRLQKVEACTQFSFEQGYSIAEPSLLKTRLQVQNEKITRVEVAGRAQTEKYVDM